MPPSPRPAAAITVRDCSVQRGGRRGPIVVDGVDLDVASGDFLAIVGTNGAGKTTLLQAIAGVIPPPRGSVDVLGMDPSRADARDRARRIGFVFQNPEHQFVAHTVADELELGLRLQGVPEAERHDEVERMLRRFDLVEHRDRHPFLLSGGQKRRLSVGTALVAGAPVLALDEPTFGQDRARAAELLDILRALNDEGTTVLVVTHDLQLVADYADRVAVMRGGRVIGSGPTAEVLAGPLIEAAGPAASAARARHPRPRAPPRVAVGHADVAAADRRTGRRMSAATATTAVARNPYAEPAPAHPARFLHALNPLAKLAAPLPVMVALLFTRGVAIPLAFIALALVLLLVGARLSGRALAALLVGLPVGVLVLGVSFGVWVDPSRIDDDERRGIRGARARSASWQFTLAAYLVGLATALRIAALLMLSLIAGLTTTGPELVRALVQNLRVPVPHRLHGARRAAVRAAVRTRARGHPGRAPRARHRRRTRTHRRGAPDDLVRDPAARERDPARGTRRARHGRPCLRRPPDAHRTHRQPLATRDTLFVVLFWITAAAIYAWPSRPAVAAGA